MGMDRSYRVLLDPCVKNFDVALSPMVNHGTVLGRRCHDQVCISE